MNTLESFITRSRYKVSFEIDENSNDKIKPSQTARTKTMIGYYHARGGRSRHPRSREKPREATPDARGGGGERLR